MSKPSALRADAIRIRHGTHAKQHIVGQAHATGNDDVIADEHSLPQRTPGPDARASADMGKVPDVGALAEHGAVIDDRTGVDRRRHQNTNGRPTRTPSRALR